MTAPDPLLSVEEVAAWLQVPVSTLYSWRTRGGGPPACRMGRYIRYDRRQVQAWIDDRSQARTPVPTPVPARGGRRSKLMAVPS